MPGTIFRPFTGALLTYVPAFSISACHIGQTTSSVNLPDFARIHASTGLPYGRRIVTPSAAQNSPIINKLRPQPEFESRMPFDTNALSNSEIAFIEDWINDGVLNI